MKLQEFFDKGNMVQAMTNSQINFKRFVCFFLFIVQVTVNLTYKYFPIFQRVMVIYPIPLMTA